MIPYRREGTHCEGCAWQQVEHEERWSEKETAIEEQQALPLTDAMALARWVQAVRQWA